MQYIFMFINGEIIEINENELYHIAFCKLRNVSPKYSDMVMKFKEYTFKLR